MKKPVLILTTVVALSLFSCGGESNSATVTTTSETPVEETEEVKEVSTDPMENKGVGPIQSISLSDIDPTMADAGKTLFETKCSACHKLDVRAVGPPLNDVTKRRSPEWIMNMILAPEKMTKEDPIAMEMLAEYMAPMANQSLTEDEARSLLEYFRSNDNQ